MVIPFAAAGGAQDALVTLFVVLLAAKLGEEVCRRIGQPPIVGEILAGVLIGPSVLGLVEPDAVLEVFSELGVVFLLFVVGLESRLADMRAVGGRAVRVGLLGVLVPFAGGFALGEALGDGLEVSLFLGAALMATSAGITSAVLLDLGAGDRASTRTILGAAVVDDVLALLLLSVVVGISGDGVSLTSVGLLLIGSVVFIGVVAVGGSRLLARYPTALKAPTFTQTGLLPAVLLCLGLAAIAGEIGLAAIIGAFLAGMVVAETRSTRRSRKPSSRPTPSSRRSSSCSSAWKSTLTRSPTPVPWRCSSVSPSWRSSPSSSPAGSARAAWNGAIARLSRSAWCRAARSASSSQASAPAPASSTPNCSRRSSAWPSSPRWSHHPPSSA